MVPAGLHCPDPWRVPPSYTATTPKVAEQNAGQHAMFLPNQLGMKCNFLLAVCTTRVCAGYTWLNEKICF